MRYDADEKVGTAAESPATAPDQPTYEEVDVAARQSNKSPAFQFYPRDFLSSPKVDLMSMAERGIYITLLSRCWLDNGLPTDTRSLAKFARMKHAQFERAWTSGPLHECFYERGQKLHNERLDRERKVQADFRKRQAENGAKGGRPKKAVGSYGETQPETQREPKKSSSSASAICNPLPQSASTEDAREPLDVWFDRLKQLYPPDRVTTGHRTMTAFVDAIMQASGNHNPEAVFGRMLSNLAVAKRSHQWRVKGMIPRLEKWLMSEWEQELPEAPQVVSEKTARTLAAAAEVMREGE